MSKLQPAQSYPSDLTDEEWMMVESLLPLQTGAGRPATIDKRQVLNALLYIDRTGCPWRYLPRDFPPFSSVRYYFDRWRADGTWQRVMRTLGRPRHEAGSLSAAAEQHAPSPNSGDTARELARQVNGSTISMSRASH
jgi:putative transposase